MEAPKCKVHADAEVTEAGVESFPASDPPAFNQGDPHERKRAGVSPSRGRRIDDQARAARQTPNSAQFRDTIPSERTPGKTSAEDPAAAPFDTDDEAAGRPPTRAAIDTALRHEAEADSLHTAERQRDASALPRNLLLVGAIAIVLVALWMLIV